LPGEKVRAVYIAVGIGVALSVGGIGGGAEASLPCREIIAVDDGVLGEVAGQ
jgi:hypothetical protein